MVDAHEAMHAGHVHEVTQPSTEPTDPNIGTDTLLSVLLSPQGDREPTVHESLSRVCAYAERLHALVRWLGLSYFGNEPTWLEHDAYGHELADNKVLAATWRGVMGGDAVTE